MTKKWTLVLVVVAALAVAVPFVLYAQRQLPQEEEPIATGPSVSSATYMQANGAAALMRSGFARTDVTVHSFKRWRSDDDAAQPATGNVFYALDVTLSNDTGLDYNLDPASQFFVVTTGGDAYWPATTGPMPRLRTRSMENGAKTRGFVCFEVPEDAALSHFVWGYQKYPLSENQEPAQ